MDTPYIEQETVVCPEFNGLSMCALIDGYIYNVPCTLTVHEKAERIKNQLARGSPMTDLQMRNLMGFIARSNIKRF